MSLPTAFSYRRRWLAQPLLLEALEDRCLPCYAITDLGTLGGELSLAAGLNASGQVAGTAETEKGELHAFRYDGGRMIDLGALGGFSSNAGAINDRGWVVGTAETDEGRLHAS